MSDVTISGVDFSLRYLVKQALTKLTHSSENESSGNSGGSVSEPILKSAANLFNSALYIKMK